MAKKKRKNRRSATKMFASDSRFLASSDVKRPTVLTIDSIDAESMPNDGAKKSVCHWHEDDLKPLVLNKTNGRKLAELFGDDVDEWPGERVELHLVDTNDREGQRCKGIRVRKPAGRRRTSRATSPPEQQDADEYEDDELEDVDDEDYDDDI